MASTVNVRGVSRKTLLGRAGCALLGATALFGGAACDSLGPPLEDPNRARLIIPTDERPSFRAARLPPPVSGGTLLVTQAGNLAVASDPERDQIVVADLAQGTVLGKIALESGDEPGRLLEDAAGRVHVALRRGGALLTIDPASVSVLFRRGVCGAPRGLALSAGEVVEVACADGALVSLPAAGGEAIRSHELDADLRDVVSSPEGLRVSRFKSGELVRVDAAGTITRRDHLPLVNGTRMVPDETVPSTEEDRLFGGPQKAVVQPFRPGTAWRSLAGPNGSTVVVHQRALEADIDIVKPTANGNAYGSGMSCGSIAQNAVSVVGADGSVSNLTFAGAPLPVDATLMPDGHTLVVAHAGPQDQGAPHSFVVFGPDGDEEGMATGGAPFGQQSFTVSMLTLPELPSGGAPPDAVIASEPGCTSPNQLPVVDQAVAVASSPRRPAQIVVQTTQPSTLVVFDDIYGGSAGRTISFDDGTTLDTGFQLFHRDSGAGVACATCHAEGAEDGHVWRFKEFGPRRSQALHVGLAGTAPFHWDGKLATVGALMSEVFVGRMGGSNENAARLKSLEEWLFAIKAPVPLRRADDPAVQRGGAIFRTTGCVTCHSGSHFTNNTSAFVGTSNAEKLQVPSLIGVGYRAPFLHDGCAKTLMDRFTNTTCGGGELHGNTAGLDSAALGDLVAYLEAL